MSILQLYHVSPARNYASIVGRGISPAYSKGKRKVAWVCEWKQVGWALAHVSQRHATLTDDLMVFITWEQTSDLKKTRWEHVYQSDHVMRFTRWLWAREILKCYEKGIAPDDIPF